jgi:hypothetical protein
VDEVDRQNRRVEELLNATDGSVPLTILNASGPAFTSFGEGVGNDALNFRSGVHVHSPLR